MTPHLGLLLLAAAAAPEASAPVPAGPTIVVTGTPLPTTKRRLADCLARICPPDEDIAASLAHAENLFIAGRYREARATTRASLGRNARFIKTYPLPLSGLYRADSRISAHLGDRNGYYFSGYGIRKALKGAFPPDDPLRLGADIEVGDMLAALGSTDRSRRQYEDAARTAERGDRAGIAAMARVRLAWLDQIGGDAEVSRRRLRAIAEDMRPEVALPRLAALALLARLDRIDHRMSSSDALIEEIRRARLPQPVLVFSPPIDISGFSHLSCGSDEPYWADIGFQVGADGLVGDVELLRSHGRIDWVPVVLRAISARIYAPADPVRGQGSYRVERYSYTSMLEYQTRSRIMVHGPPQLKFLDLTNDPEPKPEAGGARAGGAPS